MGDYNAAILDAAGEYLGVEEWPGAKHNPTVLSMFATVGHKWVQDDETAWCAAFVGSVLAQLGLPNTGKLNARSYLDWGMPVAMADAAPGDVVVLWRGSRSGWQGHVAFLVRFDGDRVILRGGNQGNKVSDAGYSVSRILGIRRADGAVKTDTGRPTIRQGDRGAFVLDLQDQLHRLGYFAGALDGAFGPLTGAALRDFQNRNGLDADGICGPKTWAALATAEKKPEREIDAAELRARGSKTIESADKVDVLASVGGLVATGREVADAATGASGVLDTIERLVTEHWIALAVIAVIVGGGLIYSAKIKSARIRDARTGANTAR